MIQYLYFNTNRGGEDRLSVSMEAPDYVYYEALFRKLKSLAEGNGFTYATLKSGRSVFMQSSGSGATQHAMGMVVDRMSEYPCKYINKFETELENLDSIGHKLPEGELPMVSRRAPEFPTERSIHRAIPGLVDAIACGDSSKKIIIITGSQSESEQVMSAISAILPKKMMAGIGFSIGARAIESSEILIKNPGGRDDVVNIRIWLPELESFRMESYASDYYVFDLKNDRDNYSDKAGALARVLGEINLSDIGEVKELIGFISDAFNDDGVDAEMLKNLCTDYLLQSKKDPEIAREILKSRDPKNPKDKLSLISAISVITDPQNAKRMTSDDLDLVLAICSENADLRKSTSGAVMEYIANKRSAYEDLSAEGKAVCVSMIADDTSGAILGSIYNNWWMTCASSKERDQVSEKLFGITCDTIKSIFKTTGRAHAMVIKSIVNKAVHFFNVDIDRLISDNCKNIIFSIALGYKEKDVRIFAASTLMATAYLPGVDIKYVKSMTQKLQKELGSFSANDQIDFIFEMRKTLMQIAEEDRTLELSGQENFPFTCDEGTKWCYSILGVSGDIKKSVAKSASVVLSLHMDALGLKYEGMIDAIEKLLLDPKYVVSTVKPDNKAYAEYLRFYDNVPESQKTDNLREVVEQAEKQMKRDEANKGVIFENMREKFKMLSKDDQKRILDRVGIEADKLSSLNNAQKRKFVEELSTYPHQDRPSKIATSILIDYSFLLTAAFPIISALLLILPALLMVTFSSIDVTLAVRLNGYLNSLLMVGIPIAELIMLVVMYRLTQNAGKKTSRTVTVGILYNIPIIIYDIIILVLFYTGYSLNSLF